MKVLSFINNSVQEKKSVSRSMKQIETLKTTPNFIANESTINIKNFKDIASKIALDDTLDLDAINKFREELSSKKITSEVLAEAIIKEIKDSQSYKRF